MVKYVLLKSTVPVTALDHGVSFRGAGFDVVDIAEFDEPIELPKDFLADALRIPRKPPGRKTKKI